MNSIATVFFVVFATIVGKWLLFDDDDPDEKDLPNLRISEGPSEPHPSPLSKSA